MICFKCILFLVFPIGETAKLTNVLETLKQQQVAKQNSAIKITDAFVEEKFSM